MTTSTKLKLDLPIVLGMMLIIALNGSLRAQVYYSYDDNGNRIHSANSHKPIKKKDDSAMVKVYPNPTAGQVSVIIPSLKTCEHASVYLLDASSRVISTMDITKNPTILNISKYAEGIYYLRVIACDKQYVNKIVKVAPGTDVTQPANTVKSPPSIPK